MIKKGKWHITTSISIHISTNLHFHIHKSRQWKLVQDVYRDVIANTTKCTTSRNEPNSKWRVVKKNVRLRAKLDLFLFLNIPTTGHGEDRSTAAADGTAAAVMADGTADEAGITRMDRMIKARGHQDCTRINSQRTIMNYIRHRRFHHIFHQTCAFCNLRVAAYTSSDANTS